MKTTTIFALLAFVACTQADPAQYKALNDPPVYGESNGVFYDATNDYLSFFVNDTEVAYITSAGALVLDGAYTAADLAATDDLTVGDDASIAGGLTIVEHTIGIPFHDFRIYDNIDAILDQAAADDDDLTLIQGTFGTAATTVETIDCGGLADTPQYAAFWFVMPSNYLAGSTVSLVANAGMVTTVADQAATLDFSCYVPDYTNEDATVSSDLITTAAQSVNFTAFADYTFAVDDDVASHVLGAGDIIQCRMTALCDDDGNAAGGITVRVNKLSVVIST